MFLRVPGALVVQVRTATPRAEKQLTRFGLQALEVNFREKLETREDLETTGVVIVFREAWMEQVPQTEFTSGESQGDIRATQVLYPMAQKAMGTGMYCPNRQSMLCSQKHCSFWKHCEEEFGGRVRSS